MTFPVRELRLAAGTRRIDRPWLMGIVNASPESFSDGDQVGGLQQQVDRARDLIDAGADLIDIGGESGVTGIDAIDPADEIARVVPLIERVSSELGAIVSIDTYKPAVADAALAAGAAIVNDVSGLRDPELATVVADHGAALVLMHTRTPPKVKLLDDELYGGDVAADVAAFLGERIEQALERGVGRDQLVLDPGPDFAKTPSQTIDALRALPQLHDAFGLPLLLAISRKDFVGALTARGPRDRDAGTLAALAEAVDGGAHIVRLHDVAAARDFLTVRAALRGELDVDPTLRLDPSLRRQRS